MIVKDISERYMYKYLRERERKNKLHRIAFNIRVSNAVIFKKLFACLNL